jgi:hypothetical protein
VRSIGHRKRVFGGNDENECSLERRCLAGRIGCLRGRCPRPEPTDGGGRGDRCSGRRSRHAGSNGRGWRHRCGRQSCWNRAGWQAKALSLRPAHQRAVGEVHPGSAETLGALGLGERLSESSLRYDRLLQQRTRSRREPALLGGLPRRGRETRRSGRGLAHRALRHLPWYGCERLRSGGRPALLPTTPHAGRGHQLCRAVREG